MTKTYIADIKNYLFFILGGVILNLALATIIGGFDAFVFLMVFNIIYIVYQLRTFRPKKISLDFDNKRIMFTHSNILKSERTEIFEVNNISFTYRKRTISNRINDVRNVCIIGNEMKTIAVLTPKQDGWTDIHIKNIAYDLIEIGAVRITEKYNDKEIPIIQNS